MEEMPIQPHNKGRHEFREPSPAVRGVVGMIEADDDDKKTTHSFLDISIILLNYIYILVSMDVKCHKTCIFS